MKRMCRTQYSSWLEELPEEIPYKDHSASRARLRRRLSDQKTDAVVVLSFETADKTPARHQIGTRRMLIGGAVSGVSWTRTSVVCLDDSRTASCVGSRLGL